MKRVIFFIFIALLWGNGKALEIKITNATTQDYIWANDADFEASTWSSVLQDILSEDVLQTFSSTANTVSTDTIVATTPDHFEVDENLASAETTTNSIEKSPLSAEEMRKRFVVSDGNSSTLRNHQYAVLQSACLGYEHWVERPNECRVKENFLNENGTAPYTFLHIQSGGTHQETDEIVEFVKASSKTDVLTRSSQPNANDIVAAGMHPNFVVVTSAGNTKKDDIFGERVYRNEDGLWIRSHNDNPVQDQYQDDYNNVINAVEEDRAAYVAGYVIRRTINGLTRSVKTSELEQIPVHQHINVEGTLQRASGSTSCSKYTGRNCFWLPYGIEYQNVEGEKKVIPGTSFGSPRFGAILASAIALDPSMNGTDALRLARECAIKVERLGGAGIPNWPCMKRKIAEKVNKESLNITINEDFLRLEKVVVDAISTSTYVTLINPRIEPDIVVPPEPPPPQVASTSTESNALRLRLRLFLEGPLR